jgi:hypothetical protein
MSDLTQTQIIQALSAADYAWQGSTITFSVPQAGADFGNLQHNGTFSYLSAAQADQFRLAMNGWSSLIATKVVETDDRTNPGDIRVVFNDGIGGNAAGTAAYPTKIGLARSFADGLVELDYARGASLTFASSGPDLPNQGYWLLLHEIGHAFGLKHPFDAPYAQPAIDTRYSVMAYTGTALNMEKFALANVVGGLEQSLVPAQINTPLVDDILTIQSKYGANPMTATGNDTYTFDPNIPYVRAIYDAGGIDTIDLSGHQRPSRVDLAPGAYSSIDLYPLDKQEAYWKALYPGHDAFIHSVFASPDVGTTAFTWSDDLGIAYSTTIENVIGGDGDDTVSGNTVGNTITGGAGADSLSGDAGNDQLLGGPGRNTLFGGDGNDTITGGDDAFDQVNGNQGQDSIVGRSRVGDWLLGGKGNDRIDASASTGHNIVNGNLGDDTLTSGSGGDTLRGGQGDDVIVGGTGGDWITGDLGMNTITGGEGADTFHAAAGTDTITDFSTGEHDRVQVDPGITYQLSQAGADVHVDLSSGGHLILRNVQLADLADWLITT